MLYINDMCKEYKLLNIILFDIEDATSVVNIVNIVNIVNTVNNELGKTRSMWYNVNKTNCIILKKT